MTYLPRKLTTAGGRKWVCNLIETPGLRRPLLCMWKLLQGNEIEVSSALSVISYLQDRSA